MKKDLSHCLGESEDSISPSLKEDGSVKHITTLTAMPHQSTTKNFGTKYEPTDITKVGVDEIPDCDLICGGFPCQSFSIAGERMGFEDTRGTLFFEIARIIKAKQPQYVLLENVKGLLSHDMGRTALVILSTLDELGYDVEWQSINARYYVPQNRERIFFIAHSRKNRSEQVFPIEANDSKFSKTEGREQTISQSGIASTLKAQYYKISADSTYIKTDRIAGIYDKDGKRHQAGSIYNPNGLAPTLDVADGGHRQPIVPVPFMSALRWQRTEKGKEERRKAIETYGKDYTPFGPECRELVPSKDDSIGCLTLAVNKDTLIGINKIGNIYPSDGQAGNVYDKNGLSPTLSPAKRGGSAVMPIVEDKDKMTDYAIRRLTPTECERLMGFPDGWSAKGIDHNGVETDISDTQRYKMCGNSIVTNVVDAIVEKLNETLEVEEK